LTKIRDGGEGRLPIKCSKIQKKSVWILLSAASGEGNGRFCDFSSVYPNFFADLGLKVEKLAICIFFGDVSCGGAKCRFMNRSG
jgi:hypothetical protein